MPNSDNYSSSSFDGLLRLRTARCCEAVSNHSVSAENVKAKVIEDIHFLRARISHVKRTKMAFYNPEILATYESMLTSREAVLEWLDSDNANHQTQRSSSRG